MKLAWEKGKGPGRQSHMRKEIQIEVDILRMAVMRPYARFRDPGMRSGIVMTIHDAVFVEVPLDEEHEARRLLKEQMVRAAEQSVVPLAVDLT